MLPTPVNKRLLELYIRHSVFIERYKTNLVAKIVGMFNKTIWPDVEKLLLKHIGRETITAANIRAMAKDLFLLNEVYKDMHGYTESDLIKYARIESSWLANIIKEIVPIKLDFTLPPPAVLKSLASESYVRGKIMKDWFSDLGAGLRDKIVQQINIGMVEGQSVDQIVRRIRGTKAANFSDGILEAGRRDIESIVRTSVATVNGQVRSETYQSNDDIIKGEYIDATLDARTCVICAALDRKEFDIGKGPQTPIHWNCRCNRLPVLKSWKELDINLKEAPAGTRASMDGQVPESLTYGNWLKQQPDSVQEEVLGIGKAEMFQRGEVSIDRFIDARNRPLTLNQLTRLEDRLIKSN
jgi:SPP1 gp7 family putative phage head morphogenesis protein